MGFLGRSPLLFRWDFIFSGACPTPPLLRVGVQFLPAAAPKQCFCFPYDQTDFWALPCAAGVHYLLHSFF